jgi:hypothetical protein
VSGETLEVEDLKPYIGSKIKINGVEYELDIDVDSGGIWAVWFSDKYWIYATPNYDGVSVPVAVNDEEGGYIDSESYVEEVNTFEEYSAIVKTLASVIINKYEKR